MEHIKENALDDFIEMIKKSWTYNKLTKEEQKQLEKTWEAIQTKNALKGSYNQRWDILHAIYEAFLLGVGYSDFNWRDN